MLPLNTTCISHFSFSVGSTSRDLGLCDQLFTCASADAARVLREALMAGPAGEETVRSSGAREGRATCMAAGAVCPGVSIGCAMCGMFLPGTCGERGLCGC